MKPSRSVGIQYAALPYRVERSQVSILLITSRETRRWVIPKGWPMGGLRPQEAAAEEAADEAGILGEIEPTPLGSYRYVKHIGDQDSLAVQVIVFPFRVEGFSQTWKEQGQRAFAWFRYQKAASLVAEHSLKRLVREFGAARTPALLAQSLHRYRSWRMARAH